MWSPCFLFFILTVSLQLILNVILFHIVPILFNIFNSSKPCTIKCLLFHRANISKNLFGNFFHNKKFSHQFVLIISITWLFIFESANSISLYTLFSILFLITTGNLWLYSLKSLKGTNVIFRFSFDGYWPRYAEVVQENSKDH